QEIKQLRCSHGHFSNSSAENRQEIREGREDFSRSLPVLSGLPVPRIEMSCSLLGLPNLLRDRDGDLERALAERRADLRLLRFLHALDETRQLQRERFALFNGNFLH